MRPSTEAFLEFLRDENIPAPERSFYATREVQSTRDAIDALRRKGDVDGLKFAEDYLRLLHKAVQQLGLKVDTSER